MQISSRFTIAIHIFACVDVFKDDYKLTSDFLANSINVNPVIIRKVMQQLKRAELINVAKGTGGIEPTRPLSQITLLDIFRAVDSIENNQLFHFHENPNTQCPVGRNIHNGLDDKLLSIQQAMENRMAQITVADVINDTQNYIKKEND
ncbi:MAG: Rrf2 family transcriptional regulator [Ruminococcus sp.]|nr:Rrf2 family transcriptional regulator [Ruminococcus sp.]MCD7800991.1 Rrf2 family transcriptional regulator [Ruminococcus sp.]